METKEKIENVCETLKSRYDRQRMGLPPIAENPLEQSLRSWL